MFSICGILDGCMTEPGVVSSCVGADGICPCSSCVPSIELTSAGAISEPSNDAPEVGGTTSDVSMEGTMLLTSETDGSAGRGTSGGTGDSVVGRLCCAIMLGTSASAFIDG